MITAACQHTGLEFEARSKAAKNHPAVSDLLSDANKRGAYQSALDAIREVRAALGETLTLADVEQAVTLAVDGRRAELQAQRDLWRERKDAARCERNAWIYGAGSDNHPDNITNAELMADRSAGLSLSGPSHLEG